MKVEMVMPQMGESIAEGTILKWLKAVGDPVQLDEDILEISTDKVDSEIPAPAAGILVDILVPEGKTVAIKTMLAIIETSGEETHGKTASEEIAPPDPPSPSESSPHDASDHGGLEVKQFQRKVESMPAAMPATESSSGKSSFLSPLVQNLASEAGIPLSEVLDIPGSGKDGRVTKGDVLDFIEKRKNAQSIKPATPVVQATLVKPPAPVVISEPASVWRGSEDVVEEMDRMRRLIAEHMVHSVHTAPHVASISEVDMNRIVTHREASKSQFREREGVNLTYTAYFIHCAARALVDFPYLNASVDGTKIIRHHSINVGFAVELPGGGLIVPIIRNADGLNLKGTALALHNLSEKARAGRLSPDDITGGTFTITNVGVFGSITGTPIIHQPQVAILATGAVRKQPVIIETSSGDALGTGWRMMASLSYDHRLIDGAMAGRFMHRIQELLKQFKD